jgi:hypothetical protein
MIDPNPNSRSTSFSTFLFQTDISSIDRKKVTNKDQLIGALQQLHMKNIRWVAVSYVEGKKDEVELVQTGDSLEALRALWPRDRIIYAIVSQNVVETTATTIKNLLVTMVGPDTGALVKARSGAHRAELFEFVKGVIPIHSHFQALGIEDIDENHFLAKLRQ